MKYIIKLFICLAAIFFTPGSTLSQETSKSTGPLIIGIPHSTRYPYATMMKNSIEMALVFVNKQGGVNGRPLRLIYGNDQGKREAGEKVVKVH